jgi:hypothetical protein
MLHPPSPASNPVPGAETGPATAAELPSADENLFLELRRKVQESQLLAAATERLLHKAKFNGRLTVVVHNGRIFKSAYEEGYFRRKNDLGCG